MEFVCVDQHGNIFNPRGRKPDGLYVIVVAQDKEDLGERVKSPSDGVCALSRISLAVGSRTDIIINGPLDVSFLVRNTRIIARGKPDELGKTMPEKVHKLFERFSLYSAIVYLTFGLPSGNRLWVENSFVALHKLA